MKTFLPLSSLSILLSVLMTASAVAQIGYYPGGGFPGGSFPAEPIPGAVDPGAFEPTASPQGFMTRFATKFPGNVWFSYTGAGQGLGWDTGGFFTLGSKTRLGTDLLDGRWLLEARGHLAHQHGQVFGNLGIERIFTITPAKSDIGFNFFVDADGDRANSFGHNFWSVGAGGFLRHEKFELRGNGYIPIGQTGYRLGDPDNCFFQHNLITQQGIDTALAGFDIELSIRPWQWQFLQGHLDVGGYYYADPDQDLTGVESFGGVRLRGRVTTQRGVSVEAEYNYDDRFKATIIGRVVISTGIFGQYSRLGRDLDPTRRNDHIVRVHQDAVFAIDPDTGLPYVVYHVDNTAAAGGDGSVETPYNTLAAAETASAAEDIIYVNRGDGTTTGQDQGITLKNGQFLLGNGTQHVIPVAGGGTTVVCSTDTDKPVITNANNGNIVTLADRNTVAGLTLDGSDPATNGIVGNNIAGGVVIQNNMFVDLLVDGINIDGITGDINISNNMFDRIGGDAIELTNIFSVNSTMLFSGNTIGNQAGPSIGGAGILIDGFNSENAWTFSTNTIVKTGTASGVGGDGIALLNANAVLPGIGGAYSFSSNSITAAGGHGINLTNVLDPEATFIFSSNTVLRSGQDGIHMSNYDGLRFLFAFNTTSENVCSGVYMEDYAGLGGDFDFLGHVADANSLDGIFIDTADGDFTFTDSQIGDLDLTDMMDTGNERSGIRLFNATNTVKGTNIVINTSNPTPRDPMTPTPSSIIQGNGTGSAAGIHIELDSDVPLANPAAIHFADALITNSTIDSNGVGIKGIARGDNANLQLDIINNLSISNNRKDGIRIESLRGANVDLLVASFIDDGMGGITPQMITGNGSQVGVGIRLLTYDQGTGLLTTLNALINNNTVTGNGGDGTTGAIFIGAGGLERNGLLVSDIYGPPFVAQPDPNPNTGPIAGNANINVRIDRNTLAGGGDLVHAELDINNTLLNTLIIDNNDISTGSDGIQINSNFTTHLDNYIRANTINNVAGRGISLELFDDTRTRTAILDNELANLDAAGAPTDMGLQGILLLTQETARALADISSNTVTSFGFNGIRSVSAAGTAALDPASVLDARTVGWSGGIDVVAMDDSNIAVKLTDNHVEDSGLQGIGIFAGALPVVDTARVGIGFPDVSLPASTANIDALVFNNNLVDNDQTSAVDTNNPAGIPITVKSANRFEFRAESNGTATSLCLSLDHNFATPGGAEWLIRRESGNMTTIAPAAQTLTLEWGLNTPPTLSSTWGGAPPPPANAGGGHPNIPPSTIITYNEVMSTAGGCIFNFNQEAVLFITPQPGGFGFPPIP